MISYTVKLIKKATPPSAKRYIKGAKRRLSRQPFIFSIDYPRHATVATKKVLVEGWIIPANVNSKIKSVRVVNGSQEYTAKINIKRPDVYKSHPNLEEKIALYSGFSVEFELVDEKVIIEVNFGKGFKKLKKLLLNVGQELLVSDYLTPHLSENYAEHLNLLANKRAYYYEDESKATFSPDKDGARLLAFYLPQFHPIPENDEVWGKGFTEWTNVGAATPRFIGHQQPLQPADLGYYDLRMEEKIAEQVALAKKYGIYGFCFYYYWFSGRRLLEKPLDSFLNHKEWDFNFAICWANENWTKRWDGRDNDVIVAQQYLEEDPLNFIKDVEHILIDPRYVTEDSKPVLLVYRASELKDPGRYVKVWRDYFRKQHNKELQLVSVLSFDDQDPREYGFDAGLDFAPLTTFFKHNSFPDNKLPFASVENKLIDSNFEGNVMDYRAVALNKRVHESFNFPMYKCVMPSWDNDARKKGKGFVFQGANPDIYSVWLERTVSEELKQRKQPIIFANAWNEWAEGTMLEPSKHLGHTVLKRTAEILAKYSAEKTNSKNFPPYEIRKNPKNNLAVILHLYYPERWEYLKTKLSLIKEIGADLYVTINIKDIDFIDELHAFDPAAQVTIVPNRGRDVLPFVHLVQRLSSAGYEHVLKVHTKKSNHRADGDKWFEELINNLIPNKMIVEEVYALIQNKSTLVGPEGHIISLKSYMGSNKPHLKTLLGNMYSKERVDQVLNNAGQYEYIAGTMFWANMDAIKPLLDLHLQPEDFESEKGQIDGTMAHAVERVMGLLPQVEDQSIYSVGKSGILKANKNNLVHDYSFTK